MIERLFWYQDAPVSETAAEYISYSKLQSMAAKGGLTTSATSVTVTAAYSANGGFGILAAGDRIEIKQPGPGYSLFKSKVAVKNSDSSIDLADAIDLSVVGASAWFWQKRSKGTTDADGWVGCGTLQTKSIKIHAGTLPASGFNIFIEGRYASDQTPETIYSRQYTALTDFPEIIQVTEAVSSLRVGITRVAAGSDGSITISLYGNPTQ